MQFGTGQGEYRRTAFNIPMIVSYITSWNIPMWMRHISTKPCRLKKFASELRNAKAKFKDVLDEATSNGDFYEVEVATARVERRYPHLIEDNFMQAQE
jgi:hypothetical protein